MGDEMDCDNNKIFDIQFIEFKGGNWTLVNKKPPAKNRKEYYDLIAKQILDNQESFIQLDRDGFILRKFNEKSSALHVKPVRESEGNSNLPPIKFSSKTEKYAFLSNFFKSFVQFDGQIFNSSEAAYIHSKTKIFDDTKRNSQVSNSTDPQKMKKAARGHRAKDSDEDGQAKLLDAMKKVVQHKFEQNDHLRKQLLHTGDRELVEDTKDSFWGCGEDGTGANHLGKILMSVREGFKEE